MKWVTLLNDLKEKVGLSQPPSSASSSSFASSSSSAFAVPTSSSSSSVSSSLDNNVPSARQRFSPSLARDKYGLELDFKRFWSGFKSSSSEKEKEAALNFSVDAFCKLVQQQTNVAQLSSTLVETHIFSFVVGRAFVSDVEKLKISSKTRSWDVTEVFEYFSEVTKDGICPGSNLLTTVEVLVSGPIDKQALLDSGIFCCLVRILNWLLEPHEATPQPKASAKGEESLTKEKLYDDITQVHWLEVEGKVVHIMKALASHPLAAQSLIEDESLELLFQMVAKGSLTVFSRYREGLVPLHIIHLQRYTMQILALMLANDNGSTAKYIRRHHMIKVLLLAVKDFDPHYGDSAYTMGIVDLLLQCVELSYRPEAGGIRLREDMHNGHGYHFLVQFALKLCNMKKSEGFECTHSKSTTAQSCASDGTYALDYDIQENLVRQDSPSMQSLSPELSRLLDVLVSLAQIGPIETSRSYVGQGLKTSHFKASDHNRSRTLTSDLRSDEIWETDNDKIKDLEAVQILQDIFLKANNQELQAEVLNRIFKIFSSHVENYKLCQELRTIPLFILNMSAFPPSFQETIIKILEYAVTVVNCVPEQELLSLCCLLQQSIASGLKQTILAFFVKLLSFDHQYKKVLREVGLLEVLLDDLKQRRCLSAPDHKKCNLCQLEMKPCSSNHKKHLDCKDVIITSPNLVKSGAVTSRIFEDDATTNVAWNCMLSLLKKADANQASFRNANGVTSILPFLISNIHRQGVLRILSCLIIEDVTQAHPEELGILLEILKSGMVTGDSDSQYKLQDDAKCDAMGTLWRILRANISAQKVFGDATGFSLLLTTLHDFQNEGEQVHQSSSEVHIKVLRYLIRAITAAVCDKAVNRMKLHAIIASQTFYDLLSESGLLCVQCEVQVIQLLLELAVEIVLSPFVSSEGYAASSTIDNESSVCSTMFRIRRDKKEVYNAGAITVIIRSLLLYSPKVQLEVLDLLEKLARASLFNQENLTSAGCVELLLEIIYPFLLDSSPLLSYALKIVEVLGAYRLSSSELRILVKYVMQMRLKNSGPMIVGMMEKLILMEGVASENVPLAPFVVFDMSKIGHGSIQVPLGQRSWPPTAGYSFVCWFQFENLLESQSRESDLSKGIPSKIRNGSAGEQQERHILRIFSVGAVNNENNFYAELYLQEDGVLTLATSNSCSLSFSGLELEEGRWHHLAVIHSKPNALAGLFQASVAYVYLDGKLRHSGKLGYSPSPVGKPLQVSIGTPSSCAEIVDLTWKLRSCYLFEEVLTSGCICFMYILGRGYRGLFQDTDMLRFVPNHACGGDTMAILDFLDAELTLATNSQKLDSSSNQRDPKADGSGIVWNLERLGNLALQLPGKKLIFAFDGTSTEFIRASGNFSLINLVDPMSAAASPIGGIPRYGRLNGDIYVCKQCVIGETIRPVGGMGLVLALVEAAETRDMLHMALTLLASTLYHIPQNIKDMQTYRGYHLLALFVRRRMTLFDMQSLEILFQIAVCEASFSEPKKLQIAQTNLVPDISMQDSSLDNNYLSKFHDESSSVGSHGDMYDFSVQKYSLSHVSELENGETDTETSNCIVLSNADMVEHVLLDWTLWVMAPVSIQIALLGFLGHLMSMHWYRNHNLTFLRKINLVQHLLVTLQRGDVEVPVLEKLVVLLGIILEDGFLSSELENVVRFVIMTFDPPGLVPKRPIMRESMGKHVIVRNMLLEMLIDLQMAIKSEELLEQWHKIVSSKLITYFLDEAVHPTSMRWIMTLLGVCLTSSHTFVLKFRTSGGYQGLMRVLQSFYDSPDIYYILFCLIFGKPVYPRLPEVRMLDFHALMPSHGSYVELRFVELLDSVISMAKSTFNRLYMQSMLAHQTGNLSQVSASLVAELVEGNTDMAGELQGEALMHKTYAARLMGGEAAAPVAATSVLRFMVDVAKMCPTFTSVCRRAEFLESCIELYFSCVRAAHAVKRTKELSVKTEEKALSDCDDASSSHNTFTSFAHEQDQISGNNIPHPETNKSPQQDAQACQSLDGNILDLVPASRVTEFNLHGIKDTIDLVQPSDSQSFVSWSPLDSPILSEKSSSRFPLTPSSALATAFTSPLVVIPSIESTVSATDVDLPSDLKSNPQVSSAMSTLFSITSKVLLELDDSGYGGGPFAAGATAVLDFLAEILSDLMTEQLKASQIIENILESVSLHVDSDSVLVFQGMCLSRIMNFLERRLLRDDEEEEKKLDKSCWSSNLDAFCWMMVDRVYMGAFPQSTGVLRAMEFLLSMLQLENKDGRIEEATPAGRGLLYFARGSRQLDAYIHSILKNTNRMILYCFLPSFLITIGEDNLLSGLGLLVECKRSSYYCLDDSGVDISTVLQLLVAHKRIIFCPTNMDTDVNCCLCVNLISLLKDQRCNVQNLALDLMKYMLVHRRGVLEDLLVSKPNQGQKLDVLHGGLDKLLTKNLSDFFDWFQSAEQTVNEVLEQSSSTMWVQYIVGSGKFPGVRIKGLDGRRKREMGRKLRDSTKLDVRHWEQINERRYALDLVRDAMSTELRVVRQDKYGWVLHAESEWQIHLHQLVHERGIFPFNKSSMTEDSDWKLCRIEGPYRMRKKLKRCPLKINSIQNLLDGKFKLEETDLSKGKAEIDPHASSSDVEPFSLHLAVRENQNDEDGELYDEIFSSKLDDVKDAASDRNEWNDDKASSIHEASLHSALEMSARSSVESIPIAESTPGRTDLLSPRSFSSTRPDHIHGADAKSNKELNDNGEFLIRPYLERYEKIRFKYNCERVVGLDKHDGIFLIGEFCLYVIENFYVDYNGCICEKECEDELSVIDQALGVKKEVTDGMDFQSKSISSLGTAVNSWVDGRLWACGGGGAWGKEKMNIGVDLPHRWRMWKLTGVNEILKRDYQLRPVAVEIFSMDGCNDLLVFHKKEREEVFKNLVGMNLPRNSMLDTTISGSLKQESSEGGRLFKLMAKSFSKRWQNGEITNFQYLMHLNTLAGRGYSDLTQYPVFPWVLADYESEDLDLSDPKTFRSLEKPMGCQTPEGEDEFRKRYKSWDDPEVPKFHYGSHYSSAGIVLYYLVRLPPFSMENQKLQGGQFDHADRLFHRLRDTWLSASGKGNTSDVKEMIPEFFYMPEFLENRFNHDLGVKQSGEKVGDVVLPPWAKGSAREFIRKHREALESDYVSENLHHWIDLIFGYKQRGKAAEEAVNVFYHYTYEGSVDIDAVTDPAMKASILAQINHFGQTPKQLFLKPHAKRRIDRKLPPHPLKHSTHLVPHEIRKTSSITQIVYFSDKILVSGPNSLLKTRTYAKYVAWGFPDRSLRFMSYDQDRLLSTHENLHCGNQIQCVGVSHDGRILVTGADDGLINVWRIGKYGPRMLRYLKLEKALCAHTAKILCLQVSQPYMLILSGSDDCTVIIWDLSSMAFVRQLPAFPAPISAIHVNDLTGEILTASGILLAVWSINGDCLAVVNTSQLPSDSILSVTSCTFSDWLDANWYVSGHQSGAIKVWHRVYCSQEVSSSESSGSGVGLLNLGGKVPEYMLVLHKVLKFHKHPVTALHLTNDLKQLLSGDSNGHLISWTIPEESLRSSFKNG